MDRADCAFLGHGWGKDAGLWLRDPLRVLVATETGEVSALLVEVEAETARGRWVAGYLAYEAGAAYGLATHAPVEGMPLAWMAVYEEPSRRCDRGASRVASREYGSGLAGPERVSLNVSREQYEAAVAAIHELIAAGDTYQVNYTCHARWELETDPLAYFLALARSHPTPYSAYLDLGERQVLSLSPELYLRRESSVLETRPMKGTRKRGRTVAEDAALREELVGSEKERAENLMIVDMARNDLGRVCREGGVSVPELFTAERYRSVWQMTSTVRGALRAGVGLAEILAATFPGASVTGAPKVRTMEIIRELEPEARGVYCGALGIFRPGGDFTLNLPIRTLVHQEGSWDLGIGAGIVWDSRTESEYEETLLKASFALRLTPEFSLFETMLLTREGNWAYREEHLERLARSAEYWGYPFDRAAAEARLADVARGAEGPGVVRLELNAEGEMWLTSREAPAPPEERVRVLLSDRRTDSGDRLLFHKTSARRLYDEEREQALAAGCWEVLFRNEREGLTEGAITNLFVHSGEKWVTPPVEEGLLPGIWREAFRGQMGASEEPLPLARLVEANRVVVGNSVRGAVEVAEIVGKDGGTIWRRPEE